LLFSMFKQDSILYQDKSFTSTIRDNYKKLLTRDMRSFQGYALSQAKRFGIKGEKYSELTIFKKFVNSLSYPKTMNKEQRKLKYWFPELEKYTKEENFKHIGFIMALGPRGSDNSHSEVLFNKINEKFTEEEFINRCIKFQTLNEILYK